MNERFEVPCIFALEESCPKYCPSYKQSSSVLSDLEARVNMTPRRIVELQREWFGGLSEAERENVVSQRLDFVKMWSSADSVCINYEENNIATS